MVPRPARVSGAAVEAGSPVGAAVAATVVFAVSCEGAGVESAVEVVERDANGCGVPAIAFANPCTDDTTLATAVSGLCPLSTVPTPVVESVATA